MEPIDDAADLCPLCGYSQSSPHLAAYLAQGTVLNKRFTVGKLISYNGESANYLAYDNILLSKVTIKEYMPDTLCKRAADGLALEANSNVLAQYKTFLSEFVDLNKTLARMRTLNHINPAIEVFTENNTAYAAFNPISRVTLRDYLADNAGELSWDEVKRLFPPLFTTLSLVHNAGIIHRGISPETIWVTDKGELKLTDFCIADARTANTELTSELPGGYAAPEQYSSNNWQGTWTDVYGLCAVIYRILTGCMPVESIGRIGNDNLIEPCKINSGIPANISKVIMQGLTISGEMRIQTVTEFVTKLFEQPEFTEQHLSQTATITIPKSAISDSSDSKSGTAAAPSKRRVFFTVGATTLAFLLVVMLVILAIMSNSGALNNISDSTAGISRNADAGVAEISYGEGGTADINAMIPYNLPEDGSLLPSEAAAADEAVLVPEAAPTEALAGDNSVLSQLGNSPKQEAAKTYIMNNFVGKMYDTVKNSETYKDILIIAPEYFYKDTVSKGQIYEQSILAGESYIKGQELVVNVSLGPSKVAVPDYIGVRKKDYLTKLSALGIKYDEQPFETTETMGGYICKTSVAVDELIDVEAGETLIVYVAVNPISTVISN